MPSFRRTTSKISAMDYPCQDQVENENRQEQGVLDTGQQQQHPVMQMKVERHSMSLCIDPDFLVSVPYADDSDAEDLEEAEETTIFPASRPGSLHIANGQLPLKNVTLRQAPLVVPSPLTPLQDGQVPITPAAVPYPPVFAVTTTGQGDDDVFVADPPGRELSEVEKMFAAMTSPQPRVPRLSSDPSHYMKDSDEVESPDLGMTHSFPLASMKNFSCIYEYKQAEKKELDKIIREQGISVCAEKPQPKENKLIKSLKKRFSFAKKTKGKNKSRTQRRSGIEDLLCASGNHEDTVDVMSSYGEEDEWHQTLPNGPPCDMSDDDKMQKFLRQSARSHRMDETVAEGGLQDHNTQPAGTSSIRHALKNKTTRITKPSKATPYHSLLLLKAPVCRPKKRLDYKRDEQARQKQYEGFCKLYPGLEDGSVQKTEETVNTFEDIENCIRKFFEKRSRALMAVIIFNGHGGEKGLKLSKGGPVPLDDFIRKVIDLLEEHRKNPDCELPHLVKIVFAQCYGHLYEEPDHEDMHIISFTNPDAPYTQAKIKLNQLTLEVEESEHKQLNSYASTVSLAEEIPGKGHSRNPSGVSNILAACSTSPALGAAGKGHSRNSSGISHILHTRNIPAAVAGESGKGHNRNPSGVSSILTVESLHL